MERIFGLETEFAAVGLSHGSGRPLDELDTSDLIWLVGQMVEPSIGSRASDRFLSNGSRMYVDVGDHPEHATPECSLPSQAAVWDQAGDAILLDASVASRSRSGAQIVLIRNNVDSYGHTYGCHENHRAARQEGQTGGWWADRLMTFLVTRTVFTGAGTLTSSRWRPGPFSLSQRAEKIIETLSSSSTRARPMFNARDETLADAQRWRRLHIIGGDTNVNPFMTWLKVGVTALLVELVERHPSIELPTVDRPIHVLHSINEDVTVSHRYELRDGRNLSAIEIQREFATAVERHVGPELEGEWAIVLSEWTELLDDLSEDVTATADRVDWVMKQLVLDRLASRETDGWSSSRCRYADVAYHRLDSGGLGRKLGERGSFRAVPGATPVADARLVPPSTTRAVLRGQIVSAAVAGGHDDVTLTWDGAKRRGETVAFDDPSATTDPAVDAFIGTFGSDPWASDPHAA